MITLVVAMALAQQTIPVPAAARPQQTIPEPAAGPRPEPQQKVSAPDFSAVTYRTVVEHHVTRGDDAYCLWRVVRVGASRSDETVASGRAETREEAQRAADAALASIRPETPKTAATDVSAPAFQIVVDTRSTRDQKTYYAWRVVEGRTRLFGQTVASGIADTYEAAQAAAGAALVAIERVQARSAVGGAYVCERCGCFPCQCRRTGEPAAAAAVSIPAAPAFAAACPAGVCAACSCPAGACAAGMCPAAGSPAFGTMAGSPVYYGQPVYGGCSSGACSAPFSGTCGAPGGCGQVSGFPSSCGASGGFHGGGGRRGLFHRGGRGGGCASGSCGG